MKKILKNSNGNAVSTGGKLLGSPEGENLLQTIVIGRGANAGINLFDNYNGDNVDFISDIDFSANTSCYYMFNRCSNLKTIPQINTDLVTNMSYMFYICKNLESIPLLNTQKVTDMSYSFMNCSKLSSVKLDTSNVNNFGYTFYGCETLKTIDITSLDKITSSSKINYFAFGCKSLTKLIIRTMSVKPALHSTVFNNCYHFLGTVDTTYNPTGAKDGRIYIPDDYVEQLKQATNWSAYADIIVPLSTLVED